MTYQFSAVPEISIPSVLTGLILVILLGALEQTVVAVAAPAITTQLHGFHLIAWVISAYLVASTVATPIYGRLSDIFGRRTILTTAITLFFLASTGCALAQTMPQLIAFRVLQGIGGGGLISVAQATIADVVPLRERGRYQGYISGIYAFASLAGPMVGGYLTHYLSWRWIFWINLPLAALAMAVVRRSLRHLPVVRTVRRIDYLGAALFAAMLAFLLIAVTRIGQGIPAAEWSNIGLFVFAAFLATAFARHEKQVAEPIIPLALLANRTVAVCCSALFICFFQFISMSVLLPLRLQMMGVAADEAALRLLPLTLAIPMGAFIAGRMMSRTGRYKPFQLGGTLVATTGSFLLAFIASNEVATMAIVMCMMGIGIGFQFPTALVATQNAVPPSQIGVATAMTSLSRLLGGTIGVAVLTSILLLFLRNVTAGGMGVESLRAAVAGNAAVHDAAEAAFRHLFLISACISALSPLLVSRLREQELRGRRA